LLCYGSPQGEIKVTAGSGGSDRLKYELFDERGDTIPSSFESNTGITFFPKLNSGEYSLVLQNNKKDGVKWCNDTASRTVIIESPPELKATILEETDVDCYGNNNGYIRYTVSGGVGTAQLSWKYWRDNIQDFGTHLDSTLTDRMTLRLSNLSPNQYYLSVTDANRCHAISATAIISEPDLLTGSVTLHDIVCYGELGHLEVSAAGGNGGYIYTYDNDKGNGYTNFPADSLFPVDKYAVKVTDRKGCNTVIGSNLLITAPSAPLAFEHDISNYNGFGVSCYGNDDGTITVTNTSGGNDASYSGYFYTLNTATPVETSYFDGLTAGDYTLTVRDARGCETSRYLQLTQPATELTFAAPVIQDVTCYYDTDGSVALTPLGGTFPYTCQMDNGDFVPTTVFDNLGAGEYLFAVKDVNGCTWNETFAVVNTVPAMVFAETIHDVNCYGGNDGSIAVALSGGQTPIALLWKTSAGTLSPLSGEPEGAVSGLRTGHYTLLATDDAGCIKEQTYTVNQPQAALALSAYVKPVCVGVPTGFIRPTAVYGTPPYRYAMDDQNFVFTDEFAAKPGVHTVTSIDANNCLTEITAEVEVRGKMPTVNFMAATLRYAMDTLVLKEINLPKPDSVFWTLASDMTMIGGEEFAPVVTTEYPGQYAVTMTGWFDGCDYTSEKTLQFSDYDPAAKVADASDKGIISIILYPNPTNGAFRVEIGLAVKQKVLVKIVDVTSRSWFSKQYDPALTVEENINIQPAPSGVYIMTVVAENDVKSVRIVIQ
jgi:hypothetical protein